MDPKNLANCKWKKVSLQDPSFCWVKLGSGEAGKPNAEDKQAASEI